VNELKLRALELAIDTGAKGEDVMSLTRDFYAWLGGTDDAPAGDAPKATRGRKSNAASAPADTAASEPSSPSGEKPPLVADEPVAADPAKGNDPLPDTAPPAAASATEPTQEQKDALLKEATEFSQKHGHDALLGALKAVGAERFSAIPFANYGDFRTAMEGIGVALDAKKAATAGASALS